MVLGIIASLVVLSVGPVVGAERADDKPLDLALIDAAWANDVERARELIAAGADVNAKDSTVQSAYLVATSEGYLELLELTLDHGADVASLDWYDGTGLIRSAERGHWQVVGRLLQNGIDPDHVNRLGWTALHEAIILGDGSQDYVDTVRLLVAGGADLGLPTGTGEYPLELARSAGQATVAATLRLALDPAPEHDLGPDAALFSAIASADADVAALAIRNGASVDATDADGTSAIDLAASMERSAIVRILEALGATLASEDHAGPPGSDAKAAASTQRSGIDEIQLTPRPKPGRFRMNLYSKGDFVHQQTTYWCVAASVQTMMNIIDEGKPRRSKALQKRLHFKARDLYQDDDAFWRRLAGESRWTAGLHGLGLRDWAGLLETSGYGRYEVERAPTRKRAVRMAARAIRMTGRPAGLVVWRGAHAWVMSGFEATGDPAYTDDFKVTKVFIQDPWYPYVSSIWGESRAPNSAVPVADLGEDFLRYGRPARRQPKRDGKFMLVLPAHESSTTVG
jgi:ankyrin repeat protein